jgi:succinoglycan biosynthesis transport protein ExoP
MLSHEQRQLIKRFLDIFLRRKKIIIICMFIAVSVGLGVYVKAPKIYRSSSLIMYQQKINPTQMSPDTGQFQDTVSTVNQQINSRSSLEGMIMQFDLYRDDRARLPMEDVVAIMRKHISVKPNSSGNVFEVSYRGAVPRTVLLVTNAVASKFIEENIRLREETVSETSAYIKDELRMAKEALNKKESAMRDYTLKYYNEMPQQRETNIARLNALQIQHQSYQNTLQELERTKVLIQEQKSMRRDYLDQLGSGIQPELSGAALIAKLQADLDALLTRYKEKHPDVRRLKSLIAGLQEDLETQKAATDDAADEQEDASQAAEAQKLESADPQLYAMQKQIENIDYNISKLHKENEKTQVLIKKYMQWIESAPVREAEWTDLTRDYNQFSKHYQGLVGQNILAGSAESLERRQKGSQFKIIDPAHFPENPFSPDFMKIMSMAIGIGLGIGVAFSLGLEFLDTSFRDAHDLESFLDLPVACSIPVIRTNKDKRVKRLKSAIWLSLFIFSLTVLGGGIALLWYKGIVII